MISLLGVEVLDHRVDVCLMKNSKAFSKVAAPFSLLPNDVGDVALLILTILVGGL